MIIKVIKYFNILLIINNHSRKLISILIINILLMINISLMIKWNYLSLDNSYPFEYYTLLIITNHIDYYYHFDN